MSETRCDPCSADDIDATATSWCTDCQEALCAECSKAHRRNRLSRHHVLLDSDQLKTLPSSTMTSQVYCETHHDLPLDFYCWLHETLCCRSCMVEEHRSCDRVVPLDEASKNIKSAPIIEELSEEIEHIINTADRLLTNADVNLGKLENQKTNIFDKISNEKRKAMHCFDNVEQKLKENLATNVSGIESKIQMNEAEITTIQNSINVSEQELDFIGRYSSDVQGYLQLRKVKQDLKTTASNLEKSISRITDMSLLYDSKTDWHVKSLGRVEVELMKCPVTYEPLHQKVEITKPRGTSFNAQVLSHDPVGVPVKEIPESEIRKGLKMKTGNMVDIWKGTWASVQIGGSKATVVKSAKDNEQSVYHLMTQVDILSACDHVNIIKMFGIMRGPPPSMVMEFMPQGNLSQYLGKMQSDIKNVTEILEELTLIAVQICGGMEYINSKRIVHTDLSAKNVLMGDNKEAKLTGFGMAKVLGHEDVLHMETAFPVAIKWTAPEVFLKRISIMSDVWSFGILLIELMTFGHEPYPGISKQDLPGLIKGGYRHPQPYGCSDVIYDVLCQCWNENPDKRPTFEFLHNFFDTVDVAGSDTSSEFDAMSIASNDSLSQIDNIAENLPRRRQKKDGSKEKCSIS